MSKRNGLFQSKVEETNRLELFDTETLQEIWDFHVSSPGIGDETMRRFMNMAPELWRPLPSPSKPKEPIDKNIRLVMSQCDCTEEQANDALEKHEGDVVNAILEVAGELDNDEKTHKKRCE